MADWKNFWPTLVQLETSDAPGGGKVIVKLATTQGASLRRVELSGDGYNPINPALEQIHLSGQARAALIDLCRPGGAVQELCAALLPVGRRLRAGHPDIGDFVWRWSPLGGTWSARYRSERSIAKFTWSTQMTLNARASLAFAFFDSNGHFDMGVLDPVFAHPGTTASHKMFSSSVSELLAGLTLMPGHHAVPSPWKPRLRADLEAVRATITACEAIRAR
jgi:hypothetical protein